MASRTFKMHCGGFLQRFCCQNEVHYTLCFPLRNCAHAFHITPVTCQTHFIMNCPSCLHALMVFLLTCLLDSFPDANGFKAMAISLACHWSSEVMARHLHGPLALWWIEKEGRWYLGWWLPSCVFAMHFSSASYIVNQDNNAILWI